MGLKGKGQTFDASAKAYDKIRPKWDWKIDIILSDPEKYLKIKSDQNGIESEKRKQQILALLNR